MLYIIAGTSLGGKTTARNYITKRYGISGIDTDTLRTITNILRPDLSVGHKQDVMTNYWNMRQTVNAFMEARSFFSDDYILEGDSINLEDIQSFAVNHAVKVVVLGYPDSSLAERLKLLDNTGADHWTHSLTPLEINDKIEQFIAYSNYLKKEAERLNLTYINTSHLNDVSSVRKLIVGSLFQ